MKTMSLLVLLVTAFCQVQAQKKLPYYTSFDNVSEQEGWTQYRFGAISDFYQWEMEAFKPRSGSYSLFHLYPVGGSEVMKDWMVSPELDLSNGGNIDSLAHLGSGFGTPQEGDTIALYLIEGNADPSKASKKTRLILFSDAEYKNDNSWYKKTDVEIPATSNKAYLAFYYHTTNNWLDVYFDNLQVSSSVNTSAQPEIQAEMNIYPNPASGLVQINLPPNMELESLEVLDNQGRVLFRDITQRRQLDVSGYPSGVYVIRAVSSQGIIRQRFLKQ